MGFTVFLCLSVCAYVLLVTVYCKPAGNNAASLLELPRAQDTSEIQLAEKTADLKRQALKILAVSDGVIISDQNANVESGAYWDDIQMTEDLYVDLKNTFDDEQKKQNSTGGERATALDFTLIPEAKWSMPVLFTTNNIKSVNLSMRIRDALNEIETKTGCITFEEVTSTPPLSHIQFTEVDTLNGICGSSLVGRQATKNVVKFSTTCGTYGIVLHETLHSLGFGHTIQRPDADQFLTIKWENIKPGRETNFKKMNFALKNQGPFDFGSIMMYTADAFSKNNDDTIVPKTDPENNKKLMRQHTNLSNEDVNILKKVYCSQGSQPKQSRCTGKDKYRSCMYWKSRGYCEPSSTYADFTNQYCPSSCCAEKAN